MAVQSDRDLDRAANLKGGPLPYRSPPTAPRVCALGLALLVLLGPGRGQAFERALEITPLIGVWIGDTFEDSAFGRSPRVDESACLGLAIAVDYNSRSWLQLLWSRQRGTIDLPEALAPDIDMNIDYLHFGSTYSWRDGPRYRPYVIASIGATYLKTCSGDDLRPSVGIGLGMKYYLTQRVGLVLEGRGLGTFMDGDSRVFGHLPGQVRITFRGDLFIQFNGQAGLVLRF